MNRPTGTRGCAYIRVSDQAQETDRQHANTRTWAEARSLIIQETYEDKGGRRHQSERRAEFQRLLKDIRAGRWDWVVIDSQERLGFKDPFEYYHMVYGFREHGVELWAATGNTLLSADDAAGVLTTGVGALASRDEMTKKAQRTTAAQKLGAARGDYMGGWTPFGCDLVCYDPDGGESWRLITDGKWMRRQRFPDGTEKRWDGRNNVPRKGAQQTLRLQPTTITERLNTLRDMYAWYIEGDSLDKIAQRLNDTGRHHSQGGLWYGILVKGTLQNSAAIGLPAWNKKSVGIYTQVGVNGLTTPTDKRWRKRDKADHVQPPAPLFPPIVPPEQYRRVQDMLEGRTPRPRAPRSDGLTLAGLIYCGHCGKRMTGWATLKTDKLGPSYCCSSHRRYGRANEHGCRLHRATQSQLLTILSEYLEQTEATIKELGDAEDHELIPLLYKGERARSRLAELRGRMECYLIQHLDIVADKTPIEDGRYRYEVPCTAEGVALDLPGSDDPKGVSEVFSWLSGARGRENRGKVSGLQDRLSRLVRSYHELDTPLARGLVQQEIRQTEGELTRLKGDDTDIRGQWQEAIDELMGSLRAVSAARRERQVDRKAALLRRVVERVECFFEHYDAGTQERSRLVRVRILPLTGTDVVEVDATTSALRTALQPDFIADLLSVVYDLAG